MNRFKEVMIVTSLIAYLVGTGCSTTTGGYKIGRKEQASSQKEIVFVSKDFDNLKEESITIDDLLEDLKTFDRFLTSGLDCQKYQPAIDEIYNSIKKRDYGSVENKVRFLAGKLENEQSQCAVDLLKQLKNFTYDRYEYVGPKVKDNWKPSLDPTDYLAGVFVSGMFLCILPLHLIDSHMKGDREAKEILENVVLLPADMFKKENREILIDEYFIKTEVNPYTGKEKTFKQKYPVSNLKK